MVFERAIRGGIEGDCLRPCARLVDEDVSEVVFDLAADFDAPSKRSTAKCGVNAIAPRPEDDGLAGDEIMFAVAIEFQSNRVSRQGPRVIATHGWTRRGRGFRLP